jgi:HEAT repeat protein
VADPVLSGKTLPGAEMNAFPVVALLKSPTWLINLDQMESSYLLLGTLAALGVAAGVLFQVGVVGWLIRVLGFAVDWGMRHGFHLWERLLSWATWPWFLAAVLGLLLGAGLAGGQVPGLRILCGLVTLLMGALACLAYMFIDLERYEVERGHKATHHPLLGQELAINLARHGQQVRVPLLVAATIALLGGFAMLNQGLYETIGKDWFSVEGSQNGPIYADFLANAFINLLGIVDVLNLAQSQHILHSAHVRQAAWPASTLLVGFRAFFTLVLLQQFFASLRQGKLLAETIADFWSPHVPIYERARNALPQYGALAIEPLLLSLRSVPSLTWEQREQMPLILTTIGPSTIPALIRHLHDAHVHVRAISIAALGRLHAVETVPLLVALGHDPSDVVRQSLVEALGVIGSAPAQPAPKKRGTGRRPGWRGRGLGWLFAWKRRGAPVSLSRPIDLCVVTLQSALVDSSAAVRTQAALALGRIGTPAAALAPQLIHLLHDADETVRCQAAEALGQIGGDEALTVAGLVELLQDASTPVKAAAARALGALHHAAAPAVPALVPLLQDREEAVRTAAAEAIARVGPLNGATTDTLAEGLTSPDTVVRAQTAEALGTIGATAAETAPALVAAMKDGNDRVRAKAVEALGKIGESAAAAAVPSLVHALRDQDNWVSALAAEALGQMGESADGAIPALVRSLGHLNPQVRGNAAEALGKMGAAAAAARAALEKATQDDDGRVRSYAIWALGAMGRPTLVSEQRVVAALEDADPLVRTAGVEAVGQWGEPSAATLERLMALLEDANEQVKVEAVRVLPRLAGATPAVIDALCRRLLEDASTWVQVQAALALGQLGVAAQAAGGPLLRAARTGEVSVREQAMRAIAMIQPPEILEAFTAGLTDPSGDIRKVASGGWIRTAVIPAEILPMLVVALSDPELQVRANAANALAKLEVLPPEAIPLLIACTADPSDGLRMNAALALKAAPPSATKATMKHLVEDANVRVCLVAASSLLATDLDDARARAVVVEALSDPALRVRKAALELVESFGTNGVAFIGVVKARAQLEEDVDLRDALARLGERFEKQSEEKPQLVAG